MRTPEEARPVVQARDDRLTALLAALLVMNERPLDLLAAEHVPAIMNIWYPGTQGGAAAANLLFGAVSPGGFKSCHPDHCSAF
jgi:hypothetical protein